MKYALELIRKKAVEAMQYSTRKEPLADIVTLAESCIEGEVPKRPKGADCKSVGSRLRRFKSSSHHKEIKRKKMRDPNRIDPIIEKLTEVWKLHPDWRLCQVLANIAVLTGWKQSDLFHFEDDELLKGIEGLNRFK